MDPVVFRGARRQEDDRDGAQRGVLAQPAAKVQPVSARDHDVQQKKCGRLALGVRDQLGGREIGADGETGALQVILDKPRDVDLILQHNDRLTQAVLILGCGGRMAARPALPRLSRR